jgi:hypothetical protein
MDLQMDTKLGSINRGGPRKASASEEVDLSGGPPLLMDFGRWATFDRPCKSILRDAHFVAAFVNKMTTSEKRKVF